ncbi:NAD(+) diphosphatase [Pseudomonas brassicacearum]|uniref:NAD(+) diphosphatase n=1 Tax=Pseudomonas brassicacearum TaxID=930166 RepID=UPI00087C7F87|nr:NAD(+) diphosphatase [Pseudomonas brassicacearum]KAB0528443.1 NAD(+) diphosphatase [Pseudomonas brassicacearum subsp. brassicacearum]NJP59345.1 NAD(+) diphosphatase [Pseudomonas brassicacearum]SDP24238.1 NAD+ diphosphatase [Pseudomonas brassicacearum]
MSRLWTSALLDFQMKLDQVLVHGPEGFLVGPKGLLFAYEWVCEKFLNIAAKHGIGFFGGQPVHLVVVDGADAVSGCVWQTLRPLMLERDIETFRMLGYAAQISTWARQHRFCGACGCATQVSAVERSTRCAACDLTYFPRLSPCMIVLVTRDDEVLLARSATFPPGLYSTLAGFVEPGESIEECVIREIREEVGVDVKNVKYMASQSWPYPHSMMFGFHAEYSSGEITPQADEIEDARWFNLNTLPQLSSQRSISRYLIDLYRARRGGMADPQLPR